MSAGVQVITCAEFHPQMCHAFAYSSSKGGIKLGDLRANALCDQHAKLFEDSEPPVSLLGERFRACQAWPTSTTSLLCDPCACFDQCSMSSAAAEIRSGTLQGQRSFFSEIISSISDMRFSRDGRYILSRDFMSVKLWDINQEAKPLAVYPVHENLRGKVSSPSFTRTGEDDRAMSTHRPRPLSRLQAKRVMTLTCPRSESQSSPLGNSFF